MKRNNTIRNSFRLPLKEKLLFAEALVLLLSAKLMLLVVPFRICILTIQPHAYETHPETETLKRIKDAVRRANRLACWKNVCLVQAFAARWMLQRRKIDSSFSIGIKPDPKTKITAHAWLMVGNQEIVSGAKDYQTITNY